MGKPDFPPESTILGIRLNFQLASQQLVQLQTSYVVMDSLYTCLYSTCNAVLNNFSQKQYKPDFGGYAWKAGAFEGCFHIKQILKSLIYLVRVLPLTGVKKLACIFVIQDNCETPPGKRKRRAASDEPTDDRTVKMITSVEILAVGTPASGTDRTSFIYVFFFHDWSCGWGCVLVLCYK